MKKLIYILIGIVTFSVSFWIFQMHPLVIPITLYELKQTGDYKTRKFTVIGKLNAYKSGSDSSINLQDYENNCSVEPQCFKSLELSEDAKNESSLLITELVEKNKTFGITNFIPGDYLAEVEVTGELVEQKEENPFCRCMIYNIKAERIKQISPIKFVTNEERYQH